MNEPVRKIYVEALNNEEFNKEIKEADPENYLKPTFCSSIQLKLVYASTYYGWLVARGEYVKSKYYQ